MTRQPALTQYTGQLNATSSLQAASQEQVAVLVDGRQAPAAAAAAAAGVVAAAGVGPACGDDDMLPLCSAVVNLCQLLLGIIIPGEG